MSSQTSGNIETNVSEDTPKEKEKSEHDADDVPGDFFDDFLKDDFMAGLDIVDEDGEDDEDPFPLVETQKDESESASVGAKSVTQNKPPNESVNKQSEEVPIAEGNGAKKPLNASLENREQLNQKNNKAKVNAKLTQAQNSIKAKANAKPAKVAGNNILITGKLKVNKRFGKKNVKAVVLQSDRRDPQKTLRDIERDKMKCEKDKEKKIISEKLMVVETGLVPPGLEMEFEEKAADKRQLDLADKIRGEPTNRVREHTDRIRGEPIDRNRGSSPRKHRHSPDRRSPRKRSLSPRRHNSGSYRGRSPRRSPRRRRSPLEPRFKRSRYSPGRHRSRSYSPNRPRKREEKKSFLEELAEKLQAMKPSTVPPHMMPQPMYPPIHQPDMSYMPQPAPGSNMMMAPVQMPYYPKQPYIAPVPVPAPMPVAPQYPTNQPQSDPYDRNYFIGEPKEQFTASVTKPEAPYLPGRQLMPISITSHETATEKKTETSSGGAAQLFQDKKISLSEFLTTTAKQEVNNQHSAPVDLRERVKVISRCQDAIKYLDFAEKRFSGCLVVYKGHGAPKKLYESPLIRANRCAIPFTDSTDTSKEQESFTAYIDRMLEAIGMKDDVPSNQPDLPAPPPPKITHSDIVASPSRECEACKLRKKTVFKTSGTQCDPTLSFSVGTQVSDEDFRPKLKSQSLAALTPAQLLSDIGQSSKFKDDYDSNHMMGMAPVRKPYQPPPSQFGPGRGRLYNPFLD